MKKKHGRFLQYTDFFRGVHADRILAALCFASTTAVCVIVLLVPAVWAAGSSSATLDASGYEISLGELNKVKKERPVKKEIPERKRRKGERRSLGAVVPPGAVIKAPAAIVPGETGAAVSPEPLPQTSSPAAITIHHDPYSFVIKGKRIVLQAVISSAENIQAVFCRFRAAEKGSYAVVPMLQAQGSLFTYVTTLPGLDAVSRALHYSIVAVDSSGKEVRSQEFVIAVKSSTVLPGWQLETSADKIKISRENKELPLEGFADPGIVE